MHKDLSNSPPSLSMAEKFSVLKAFFVESLNSKFSLLFIIFCGILVYFQVFRFDFQTFWDDQWVVVNTYTENGLNNYNLYKILTEYYNGQYAPVNQLYYTILFSFFGYNPYAFHSGSIILHILNSCLVYFFIKNLFFTSKSKISKSSIQCISFVSATMFIIHPISVESVAWISASKILLYSLFYLAGLISYLFYLRRGKYKYYIATLIFFIFSFGGKEQAVTMPICLVLLDFITKRDFRSRQIWFEKLPFFALSIFFGIITMESQAASGSGALSESDQYPYYQRIVFASYSLFEYFTKSFLPIKLSYLYPFPNQIGEKVPLHFWLYPTTIFVLFLVFWRSFKKKWIFFLLSFFVLHLAVTLHIIPIARFAITADRYAYISLIAPCLFMGMCFTFLIRKRKGYSKYVIAFTISYLFSFGLYTHFRSRVWKDTDTLKQELREIIKGRDDYKELKQKMENHEIAEENGQEK